VPFYDAPKETPEQKRRRLHLMATLGGSRAPKGTYGLPSPERVERNRAERKEWSHRKRLAWRLYWIVLGALFVTGIVGVAAGIAWLVVVAVAAWFVILVGGTAVGVRSELRDSRRRQRRSQ
jgi:hypothetical protein